MMKRIVEKLAKKERGESFLCFLYFTFIALRLRMGVAEKKRTDEPIDDSMIVDDVFGYLDSEDDNDVKRDPSAFKDLPKKKRKKSETLMKIPAAPDYNEDTSEYSFPKFAKTFFQGNITHQYSRRMIKHSLLNLTTNGDKAVYIKHYFLSFKITY